MLNTRTRQQRLKKMGRSFNFVGSGMPIGKTATKRSLKVAIKPNWIGFTPMQICYTHAAGSTLHLSASSRVVADDDRTQCIRSSLFCYELDSNLGQPKKCYNSRIFLGNKSRDSKQFLASVPWPNFAQNCTYLFKLHLLLAYSSKGNTMSVPYTHKLQLTGC
jgi:hypothetical protein